MKILISLLLLAPFFVLASEPTCPQDNGWVKTDSNDLSSYPVENATYCFKSGSENSRGCEGGLFTEIPEGGFTQPYCGLSHWSYKVEPTTEPTTEPRTEPTTEPTSEPNPNDPGDEQDCCPGPDTVQPTVQPTINPTIKPTVEPIILGTKTEETKEPFTAPTTGMNILPIVLGLGAALATKRYA